MVAIQVVIVSFFVTQKYHYMKGNYSYLAEVYEVPNIFRMKILDIQPSQLFISEMKLNKVSEWLNYKSIEDYDPVPIKKLNEKIIFTDGHTRAFALYKMGIDNIRAYWDED